MRIKMALTEKQVRYVTKGQRVDLKVDAYPWATLHGQIAEVQAVMLARDLPAALSARRSGDVATAMNAQGQEVPIERTFEASIDMDNSQGLLHPGMTGRGDIYTGRKLWGRLLYQSILDLISLDYRF
jgi:hypothetical protein